MGGYGSGRPRKGNRKTTAQVPKQDIRNGYKYEGWEAALGVGSPDGSASKKIPIAWTPAGFGGQRPWFVCASCGGHVLVVYYVDGAWVCRRCGNLVYASSRETKFCRALRKAHKIRRRIGASLNLLENPTRTGKPKGMHWNTYSRLVREALEADNDATMAMLAEMPRSLRERVLEGARQQEALGPGLKG